MSEKCEHVHRVDGICADCGDGVKTLREEYDERDSRAEKCEHEWVFYSSVENLKWCFRCGMHEAEHLRAEVERLKAEATQINDDLKYSEKELRKEHIVDQTRMAELNRLIENSISRRLTESRPKVSVLLGRADRGVELGSREQLESRVGRSARSHHEA